MTRLQITSAAVVTLLSGLLATADEGQISSKRMDDGGTVIANVADGEQKLSQSWAKVRDFLWRHWNLRVTGRIVVVGTTTEGSLYKTTYVIKLDAAGSWIIDATSEGEYFDSINETSEHWHRQFEAHNAVRVRRGKEPRAFSPDARVAPKDYRLVLRDKTGKIVAESL